MRVVSLLVLGTCVSTCSFPSAEAEEKGAASLSEDADVAKIVAVINEQKDERLTRNLQRIDLRIDRTGRTKAVNVSTKGAVVAKAIESKLMKTAFSGTASGVKEKKIRLLFKS